MPQQSEILPGGLVIINPLPIYKRKPVYKQMVRAKFKLEEVDKFEQAHLVLHEMRQKTTDVGTFVRHFDHHNQISWANTVHEHKENAYPICTLEHRPAARKPRFFKMLIDRKCLEDSNLREGARMMFRRTPGNYGKPLLGTVDYVDVGASAIYLIMDDDQDFPEKNVQYVPTILPSSLVFRSRCRTLDGIRDHAPIWAQFIFPQIRNEFAQQLIPLKEFNKSEKHFLAHSHFSPQRMFNDNQRRAIHGIVSGHHGPCPYILFGPPGTGKTVTLVEAIRQLLLADDQQSPERRILVCTPSNTAADAFALGLLESGAIPPDQLLRIFSTSKKVHEQNERLRSRSKQILCICNTDGGGEQRFGIPPKAELLQKRVLICTLNTATYLVNGGLAGYFSHIFIDEAGQADELEALIPIVGLVATPNSSKRGRKKKWPPNAQQSPLPFDGKTTTRVILAGDPQQLGPVQTCAKLRWLSRPTSLIERLIGGGQKRNNNNKNIFHFDKRVTTMLEHNYRSHPALVAIPSQLYYGGKLRSSAPIHQKNTLCQWPKLPKKDFPLIWHEVEEKEDSDKNGGHSYGNSAERKLVCQYVKALVKGADVCPADIGIITPYKYQVKLLRQQCSKYPKMLIDSVERFQGSERRVIIVSTVRSTGIGFLSCEKRFNTAVTRPMELLIVVGSSRNMRQVPGWNQLIDYCEANNALIGRQLVIQEEPIKKHNTKTAKKKQPVNKVEAPPQENNALASQKMIQKQAKKKKVGKKQAQKQIKVEAPSRQNRLPPSMQLDDDGTQDESSAEEVGSDMAQLLKSSTNNNTTSADLHESLRKAMGRLNL